MVRPTKVVRSRGFDSEDDGPIALTTGASDAAAMAGAATALVVGAPFAIGGHGKGLALRSTAASNTKAYKNHDILPLQECWIRLSFSPRERECGRQARAAGAGSTTATATPQSGCSGSRARESPRRRSRSRCRCRKRRGCSCSWASMPMVGSSCGRSTAPVSRSWAPGAALTSPAHEGSSVDRQPQPEPRYHVRGLDRRLRRR